MSSEDLPLLNFNIPAHVAEAHAYLDSLRGKGVHRIDITKVRDQKTMAQMAYLWAVVYPCVARGLSLAWGEDVSVDDAHIYMKATLLTRPKVRRDTGEVVAMVTPSLATISKEEASQYIDRVIAFARDQMMIRVPPPEQYREEPKPKERKVRAA